MKKKKGVSLILCWTTFLCDLILSIGVCVFLGYGVFLFIPLIHVLDDLFVSTTFIVGISFTLMISLASMVGCIGVVKKNCGILLGSAAFNTFTLLLIFNFIICVCFTHHSIEEKIKVDMFSSLERFNKNCTNGYSSPGWDTFQREYECCGVNHFSDWNNRTEIVTPPYSCATKEARKFKPIDFLNGLRKSAISNNVYNLGCFLAIKQNIENHKFKAYLITGIFELLIILAITFTCYLGKKIRDFDMCHDPLSGNEDYELTKIVRKHHLKNQGFKTGSLRSTRSDRIRFKEDLNQNFDNKKQDRHFTKAMQNERIINYTKL